MLTSWWFLLGLYPLDLCDSTFWRKVLPPYLDDPEMEEVRCLGTYVTERIQPGELRFHKALTGLSCMWP